MTTDAAGTPAERDLILGLTNAVVDVGAPGMVLLSKISGPPPSPFTTSDLAGPWRVYLQRVESTKLLGGTWQVGLTTFSAAGAFGGGTLTAPGNVVTTLTTGGLLVSANGSVTGTLSAGTGGTADLYTITGTMRTAKDLITGVVSAQVNGRTRTFHGLVTMVREIALFDLGQSAYTVTEGGSVTATVLRTGSRVGTATVQYAATGGTAPPADYLPAAGTLTFGPGAGSATFMVKTNANTLVDGNRSVNLVLSNPTGRGTMLGATSSAPLTIVDEDKPGTVKLSAATYGLAENKNAAIVIQRSLGTASGVVVQFATSDMTAEAGRDYTAVNGSVTFNAGETTKTVAVPITDTPIVDGSRSFAFTITGAAPPGTVIGTPASAVVTIGDLDVAGTLQFSAATYAASEPVAGTTNTLVTVTRTGGLAGGVVVSFAAADGTATAGADYTATAGTLTFGLGNTSTTFSVPILADTLVEGDETVLLTLSNPLGGAALGAQKTAVLTIKDAQKGVQFSAATFTALEGTAAATVTVVRTGPTPDVATVRYSTTDGTAQAGTNYKATSGTLTFAKDITKATFTVPLLGDKQVKGPQTVLLLLSNPSVTTALGPLSSAVLTIGDVDIGGAVKLASPTFSITEAGGSAAITVSRTGGTAGGVTVDFEATDQSCGSPPCPGKAQGGFDYQAVTGTLTFGIGETTKTILIPVTNDIQVNGNRTFLVNLANVQGGATLATPSSAVVTIVDDDRGGVFQFGAATYGVTEPAAVTTTATIRVIRTGTNLAGASIQFASGNGTATSGIDYVATATTLVFGAGETFQDVTVPILPDAATEGNETVNLTLANPGGGATLGTPSTAVLTIVDAVASARLSAATYTVTEGATATITVLRGGTATGTLKVGYATSDGTAVAPTHYTAKSGTLTFGPGISSLTFTVPTVNNPDLVDGRTVNLTLTASAPGAVAVPSTATLTILDNDASGTFQFGAAGYSVTEGGVAPAVMVTRTGGSGGSVLVRWTASGGTATGGALPTTPGADYAPTTGVLTFGPGVTSLKVPLTIVNDTLAENAETFDLTLTLEGSPPAGAAIGAPATTTVTIGDNDNGGAIQFAAATQTVAENVVGGKVNLAVTRTGTSLAGGITVGYAATGDTGAITPLSGTLTFNAAQASAMIPLTIAANAQPEADRNVTVTLSNPLSVGGAVAVANAPTVGAVSSTTLKVVDDEPRLQFAAAAAAVTEGGTATVTVTRIGSLLGQVTVGYATGGGTATPAVHYAATSGTLTFGAGVAGRTFSVLTLDDGAVAGGHTVGLTLSGPVGASLGATATATLTIQDKQSAGTLQFAARSATVVEGLVGDPGRTVHITVSRTSANLVGPVTVNWSATGGTATAVTDFSPASGTLTFEGAATSQTFDITALDDGVAEGTETIILSLDSPSGQAVLGSPSAMTVFVIDAQQSVAFATAAFTVGETTPKAVITAVRLGVPTGAVTVTATTVPAPGAVLPAVPGLDYTSVSRTLTFAAGEIVKTFEVPILVANALAQNGNRVVGLELTDPVNAALIGASSATLTILDFRADLVIASVATPGSTLAGKTLSAPTTVRNLGQVASLPFRVGIFMAKDNGLPADALPGAGSLVVQREVPALAAGAGMALPTQLAVAEDLPAGNYFVSAVANFNLSAPEADATNNGLSSAPAVLKVSSNFSKFQSASASFSFADASGGGSSFGAPAAACELTGGSVSLSGSFTILSQQQDIASGIADLTGTFNDQPVRFVMPFTGTADAANNVTASVTSITASGAFSANGLGSPPGTFTGTLNGATLSGTVTGTIRTAAGGDCTFTGPLTAIGKTSFVFRFGVRTPVGSFGFDTTPTVFPGVSPTGYVANFHVFFDSDAPDPSAVRFTGPAGSGLSNTPSDMDGSHGDEDGQSFTYRSPERPGSAPGGTWSVLYKGVARMFTVPPLNANSSFVIVYPRVTVDGNGTLTQIDWEYQDRFQVPLSGPPSFMSGIRVRLWTNAPGENQPESPDLAPTTTSYTFADRPQWSDVQAVVFEYADLLGNEYVLHYGKAFNVMVEARLENVYRTGAQVGGTRERLLSIFVDVPAFSVETGRCFPNPNPPFPVTVVNAGGGGPFPSAECLDRTGTTQFNEDPTLIDIFSQRVDLEARAVPYPLAVGTEFQISVTPFTPALPQLVTTALRNSEANPSPTAPTDFIFIPNPATPNLQPPGTQLVDARLGQNMAVSWTLPTFPIRDQFFSAIVNTSNGSFCSAVQQNLAVGATTTTFKFPTSCFGQPVVQAQFCIFFNGELGAVSGGDERTAACWFFDDFGG